MSHSQEPAPPNDTQTRFETLWAVVAPHPMPEEETVEQRRVASSSKETGLVLVLLELKVCVVLRLEKALADEEVDAIAAHCMIHTST